MICHYIFDIDIKKSFKMKDKELQALIRLLDEPDHKIYDQIKSKIFGYGSEAISKLEDVWANSFDQLIQERSLNLIHEIQFASTSLALNKWAINESDDLLKGFIIFSKYNYPDLDEEKMIAKTAKIIQDVWLELNDKLTALEKIKVINHVFFSIHKFRGNKRNFYSPDNFAINNVFESKIGNPISLGVLYLAVCQSLKIPIKGVNLPKHFILAYLDENNENEVLFYINPFNKGAVFTKNEVSLFIKQLDIESKVEYFQSCNHLTIMNRLINDMIFSYKKLGFMDKVDELENLKLALQI